MQSLLGASLEACEIALERHDVDGLVHVAKVGGVHVWTYLFVAYDWECDLDDVVAFEYDGDRHARRHAEADAHERDVLEWWRLDLLSVVADDDRYGDWGASPLLHRTFAGPSDECLDGEDEDAGITLGSFEENEAIDNGLWRWHVAARAGYCPEVSASSLIHHWHAPGEKRGLALIPVIPSTA